LIWPFAARKVIEAGPERETQIRSTMQKQKPGRRKGVTLYAEIRDILSAELAEGKYPVGSRFPTEQELCARFGTGRHTVREAMRGLEDLGLVSRQPGSGTVVLAQTHPHFFTYRIESLDSLSQYAAETRFDTHHEGVVILHDRLAEMIGAKPGERWLRVAGMRRFASGNAPICWTEIFIAEPYIGVREHMRNSTRPYFQAIVAHFDVTIAEVDRRITAVAMPADVAGMLDAVPNSPAILERRTYIDARGETFEVSLSLHSGDTFAYTTRLVSEPHSTIGRTRQNNGPRL